MHKYCQSDCPRRRPPFFNIPCLYHPIFPPEWDCCCQEPDGICQSSYAIYTVSPSSPTSNPTTISYVPATGNGPEIALSEDGTTITLAPGCVYSISLSLTAATDGSLTMTPYINGPASPENTIIAYAPDDTTPAPVSISHSFLVAVSNMPVTLRIELKTSSATNLTAITGGLSIVTVAEV